MWGLGWWKQHDNVDTYQNQIPYEGANGHGQVQPRSGSNNPHNSHSRSHNSGSGSSSRRRPPPPPTSIALDDRFDAMTTEVPTEWGVRRGGDGHGRDYEESISGYQNYVNEMERMLGGEVDLQVTNMRNSTASVTMRKIQPRQSESSRNGRGGNTMSHSHGGGNGQRGLGGFASVDNIRQVSGRKASMELVEHKIMEDGPQRTISLWRERVAQSNPSKSGEDEFQSGSHAHAHRRITSGDARSPRKMMSEDFGGRGRGDSVGHQSMSKGKDAPRQVMGGYERSEVIGNLHLDFHHTHCIRPQYLVSVQKPRKSEVGPPKIVHPASEVAYLPPPMSGRGSNVASPRMQPVNSPRTSPKLRRQIARTEYERSEVRTFSSNQLTYENVGALTTFLRCVST